MERISTISFPGRGIGEFQIDAQAISFTLFNKPFTIMWYGIIICLGIFCAFFYFLYRCKKANISADDVLDITLVTVIIGIAGARLYFEIFHGGFLETGGTFWENVKGTLYNLVAIWNGGLAIYGGILFGAATVLLMSRRKKIPFFVLADAAGPGVMIAQAIGRWGNFCNGEAYGAQVSESFFLRMGLKNYQTFCDFGTPSLVYVHPTFLYESLWNVLGFVLINLFYRKRKFHGEAFLWYVTWYGIGRTFIEMLRTDSLMLGSFRVSSLLSAVLVVALIPLLIVAHRRYHTLVREGAVEQGERVFLSTLLKKNAAPAPAEAAEEATEAEKPAEEVTEAEESAEEATEAEKESEEDTPAVEESNTEEKPEEGTPAEEETKADESAEDAPAEAEETTENTEPTEETADGNEN